MLFLLNRNTKYNDLIPIVLAIMLIPSFIMVGIALLLNKKHKQAKKILYILATVYAIVSLGLCGIVIA